MKVFFSRCRQAGRVWVGLGLLGLGLLAGTGRVQAQRWQTAASGNNQPFPTGTSNFNQSKTRAVATDASGNVFVTGSFKGIVGFGSTVLTSSAYSDDMFLAKWSVATGTWAWATRGGGTGGDIGTGVAVNGSSVYVTGCFASNTGASFAGVSFAGAGSIDVFLAKYVDNGSSVSNGWATSGGGSSGDGGINGQYGGGVAVNGTSVYISGSCDASAFTLPYTQIAGVTLNAGHSSDIFLAKYTDNGASFSNGWATSGGGSGTDLPGGVAVSGTSVYITGTMADTYFGDTRYAGVLLAGAGQGDMVLTKYTDNGASFANGWAVSGGGTGSDGGAAVAASGSSVYVTGSFTSGTGASFGGTTLTGAGASDVFVAKYTDNGQSVGGGWARSEGSPSYDFGTGIAVAGSTVYVTGTLVNTFGGVTFAGSSMNPAPNGIFVIKYLDNGSAATNGWGISGGGGGSIDYSCGVAVSGNLVYVGGSVRPSFPYTSPGFGPTKLTNPSYDYMDFLAQLLDAPPLPLPVTLTAFTATAAGPPAAVRLAWATASEVNSARFEVERSPDGVRFAAIGTVAAAGNATTPRQYTWLDAAMPAGATGLYYRLRQVDLDGRAAYSPVRYLAVGATSATAGSGAVGLRVFPNPAAGPATLSGAAPGVSIQVLDALGRVLLTATADAGGVAVLPVPGRPGVYVVRAGGRASRWVVE